MSQSLEQLENNFWPDQQEYVSGLVKRCYEYRKTPVNDLRIEQLRTLIGQNIGITLLLPIALENARRKHPC